MLGAMPCTMYFTFFASINYTNYVINNWPLLMAIVGAPVVMVGGIGFTVLQLVAFAFALLELVLSVEAYFDPVKAEEARLEQFIAKAPKEWRDPVPIGAAIQEMCNVRVDPLSFTTEDVKSVLSVNPKYSSKKFDIRALTAKVQKTDEKINPHILYTIIKHSTS